MGFSNVSKTELPAFLPQICLYPQSSPFQFLWLKNITSTLTLSLPSHLQSVSKSCCFFLQNIFKNWLLFSSTSVQVTYLSPGLLPSNWFPCFHSCYPSVYFQNNSHVKNPCHFSTQNSTLPPYLPHYENRSPYNGPTWSRLPTSFPTAPFFACSFSAIPTSLLFLKHARCAFFSRSFTDYPFFLESSSLRYPHGSISYLFQFFAQLFPSQRGLPQHHHHHS